MSKDIWVYAETNNGELCDIVPELLTKGRQLKAHSGGNLTAVVLGSADEHVIGQLSKYGADKIIIGENAALADYSARTYAHAMTELARKYAPEIFIIPATGIGREIAPLTMQALAALAESKGAVFHYSTPAVQLVIEDGAVRGVIGKDAEGNYIKMNATVTSWPAPRAPA